MDTKRPAIRRDWLDLPRESLWTFPPEIVALLTDTFILLKIMSKVAFLIVFVQPRLFITYSHNDIQPHSLDALCLVSLSLRFGFTLSLTPLACLPKILHWRRVCRTRHTFLALEVDGTLFVRVHVYFRIQANSKHQLSTTKFDSKWLIDNVKMKSCFYKQFFWLDDWRGINSRAFKSVSMETWTYFVSSISADGTERFYRNLIEEHIKSALQYLSFCISQWLFVIEVNIA